MKKHLLATTTAIALVLAPAAFAQTAAETDMHNNAPVFSQEPYEGTAPVDGFYNSDPNQVLATRFIGAYIYSNASDDAETIGDVNDIIMTPDGRAVAVIVGVGGFLGIGEKEVAVSMDELQWQTDEEGDLVLVGALNKETLENAPSFDRSVFEREQAAAMQNNAVEGDVSEEEMANAEQRMETGTAVETETAMNTDKPVNDGTAMGTDETMTSATPRMETVSAAEAQLEASEIMGMSVTGSDGETIGEVSEILIDDGGKVEAFIIDVGGFLGINEKPVAVSFEDLQFARAEGSDDWSTIKTGLTKESLEGQQAYSEDSYKSGDDGIILIAPVE